MEQPLSSLTFKGSIMEAIAEAKQQKKLFVVYVSGDNPESHNLETTTWMDSHVADSVLKFCILLHISEGSPDAANFSAIYPQKSAPCVTAIGYNGIQLLQHEGYVTADVLVSSIEKAWLSIHIQETTATFLTAALTSKKQPASASSANAWTEEGSSSRADILSSETEADNDSAAARPLPNYETQEQNDCPCPELTVKETKSKICDKASPGSDEDTSIAETSNSSLSPAAVDPNRTEGESHIQRDNVSPEDIQLGAKKEASKEFAIKENKGLQEVKDGASQDISLGSNKENKGLQEAKDGVSQEIPSEVSAGLHANNRVENVVVEKPDVSDSASKSNDVHLNVRLPDGSSLQVKFSVFDTLRMVKDFVDVNQTINLGSYDFAIPYPRKVFSDQDLGQTLLELGLSNRQTLIVVLHHRAHSHPKEGSSSRDQINANRNDSSNGNEGYWAYIRRMLTYINPFSYLGGGSNSSETVQESQNSMWQYGPNPSLRNNLSGPGRSSGVQPSNQNAAATSRSSNSRSRPQTSSGFGSNIHTLKHDEDDSRFSDRNAFWNGNSTQFGGDNDGK